MNKEYSNENLIESKERLKKLLREELEIVSIVTEEQRARVILLAKEIETLLAKVTIRESQNNQLQRNVNAH